MADHVIALSTEESAAAQWAAVQMGDPSIQTVEAWLRNRLRGELAAAVTGYNAARDAAILEGVKNVKNGTLVHDVVAAAETQILEPPAVEPDSAPAPLPAAPLTP